MSFMSLILHIYFIIDFQVTAQEDETVIQHSEAHQNIAHGVLTGLRKRTVVFKYLHTSDTLFEKSQILPKIWKYQKYQKSQILPKIWKYARKFRVDNLINTICSSDHKYEIVIKCKFIERRRKKETRPLNSHKRHIDYMF